MLLLKFQYRFAFYRGWKNNQHYPKIHGKLDPNILYLVTIWGFGKNSSTQFVCFWNFFQVRFIKMYWANLNLVQSAECRYLLPHNLRNPNSVSAFCTTLRRILLAKTMSATFGPLAVMPLVTANGNLICYGTLNFISVVLHFQFCFTNKNRKVKKKRNLYISAVSCSLQPK